MSKILSKIMNKYTMTALVAVVVSFSIAISLGLFSKTNPNDVMVAISDALFITGVAIAGVGGLFWASGQGAFDAMKYSLSLMWKPSSNKDWAPKESLYEYKLRKEKKRAEFKHLLIVGICLLVIGAYSVLIVELIF